MNQQRDFRPRALAAYSRLLFDCTLDFQIDQKLSRARFQRHQTTTHVFWPQSDVKPDSCTALALATTAHLAAHARFSPPPRPIQGRKPLHIALISLLEDARIEHLAMAQWPGLRVRWQSYYQTESESYGVTAAALLSRLAKALFDLEHLDPDPWVGKGQALFLARQGDLSDAHLSAQIGDQLANDLGQLRLPFDAKSYQVEPAYRDNHHGLWQFDPDMTETGIHRHTPIEPVADDSSTVINATPSTPSQPKQSTECSASEEPIATVAYPEWDYRTQRLQPERALLHILAPPVNSPTLSNFARAQLKADYPQLYRRLQTLIRAVHLGQTINLRQQPDGEQLDLDACLDYQIARSAGSARPLEYRVYRKKVQQGRDWALSLLLDRSRSTADRPQPTERSILARLKEATLLLAETMTLLGDHFAIAGFDSNGRQQVRYLALKSFAQHYSDHIAAQIAALRPGLSTRLGCALRQAGQELARQRQQRRLLLVLSDGEPADIDVDDPRYLTEDAHHAVLSLRVQGLDVYGVLINAGQHTAYAERIFGKGHYLSIDRIESLPQRLALLFFRLSLR